ncbi:MAG: NBR1-Ig-like domain-containing protein [Chloroflexota bacterium]
MNLRAKAVLRQSVARLVQYGLLLALGLCLLSACNADGSTAPGQDAPIFRAPTSVPQTPLVVAQPSPSPTPNPIRVNPRPSATPACTDDLRFLEDLTVPDGAQVEPGAVIDKRWKVENAGTCNWDERYRLRLIEGPNLGAPEEQALYPARGNTQAEIRILFTAPAEPGIYRSAWQAFDPQGQAFGEMIYIQISVAAP